MAKQERKSMAGRSTYRAVVSFCDDQTAAMEVVNDALTEGLAVKIVIKDDRGGNGGIYVKVTRGA